MHPPLIARAARAVALALFALPLVHVAAAGEVLPREHEHAHVAPADRGSTASAMPYATDAPLRAAMAGIDAALAAARNGGEPAAIALAGTIDASIASMIANCRLAPDADSALHAIIGRLARDAAALGEPSARVQALDAIDGTLADYARAFDPPGFTR